MLTVINFLMSVNFFTLTPTIPIYAMERFGLSEGAAGVAVGLFAIGLLTSRVIAGRFVRVIGFKRMLTIAVFGIVLITVGYFFAQSAFVLYIIRFVNGFMFGTISNTNITIVTSIVPKERSGEGVGYYSMGQMLSMAVGPFIGVQLALAGNFTMIFALCTALPAIAIILLPFIRLHDLDKQRELPENKVSGLAQFFEKRVLPIAMLCFIVGTCGSSITAFVAVFAKTVNLTAAASYFFLILSVVSIVSRPFVSKLYDVKGANVVILPALIMMAIGMIMISQSRVGTMLLVAAVIFGLGFGAFQPTTLAAVVQLVPVHRLSVANATYFMLVDVSGAIGPMIIGALIPYIGYRTMYLIVGIIVACCMILYYQVHGKMVARTRKANSAT
jgi:MFS family permease